jgi:hypothetical protein
MNNAFPPREMSNSKAVKDLCEEAVRGGGGKIMPYLIPMQKYCPLLESL